jgi:uncharacterized membrane protein
MNLERQERRQRGVSGMIGGYVRRWRQLGWSARLYLLHIGITTGSLSIYVLFFNLMVRALGYPIEFLGQLNGFSIATAAVLSLPLWWLVTRIGLKRALVLSALMQVVSTGIVAAYPSTAALFVAVGLSGMSATIFQVSAPPFMMSQSDAATRDYLFSANTSINIGIAGLGSLLAGGLPAVFAGWLAVDPESATAYRAAFGVSSLGLLLAIAPLLLIRRSPAEPDQIEPAVAVVPSAPQPVASSVSAGADDLWLTRLPGGRALLTLLTRFGGAALLRRMPRSISDILRHPMTVLPLLISPLLVSFGAALLIPYLNLFLKDRFLISDRVLGTIFASFGIAAGLTALGGPALSTRLGKIRAVALVQIISIPFLLTLGFAPALGVAVVAALVRTALFNMSSPLYDAFAMERTPESARPIVIGLINGSYTVGYLVAPFISTAVQDRYGFAPLFLATAAFYATASLVNYLLFVRGWAGQLADERRIE